MISMLTNSSKTFLFTINLMLILLKEIYKIDIKAWGILLKHLNVPVNLKKSKIYNNH